jgi:hypothetical protein
MLFIALTNLSEHQDWVQRIRRSSTFLWRDLHWAHPLRDLVCAFSFRTLTRAMVFDPSDESRIEATHETICELSLVPLQYELVLCLNSIRTVSHEVPYFM